MTHPPGFGCRPHSRYLRQTQAGRLVIDRRKIKAEEGQDDKYLLSSSDPPNRTESSAR